MASILSHAVAAVAIGAVFYRAGTPKRIFIAGAICSIVPDLDVIGFRFGVRYGDFWGHRGFAHSLLFAAFLASVALLALRRGTAVVVLNRIVLWSYLFVATASHGLLDAMTDGGLGVAFFSPFNNQRYFLPWRPIHVSPIGLSRFFTRRALSILSSELLVIWLPCVLLILCTWTLRRMTRQQSRPPSSAGV